MNVTSFEEACEKRGHDPAKILPHVSMFPVKHQAALIATAKMYLIAEEINLLEDGKVWEPDWNDQKEEKWVAWFDMEYHKKNNPSGFRFYAARYGATYTYSSGGSRLCFRTREKLMHTVTTFIDLYRDMMVIPK